jgi:hypothetical protein
MTEEIQKVHYDQPLETKSKILIKTNAKGELQPEIEVVISRKLEANDNLQGKVVADLSFIAEQIKNKMGELKI